MKIKINNTNWNVYLVDDFVNEPGCLGKTSFIRGTIELLKGPSRDKMKTTIIHELVHAYLDSYGFEVPNIDSVMLFSEEQTCEFIAMNGEAIIALANKIYKKLVLRV